MSSTKNCDLKYIMKNIEDLIITTDETGSLQYISPSCSAILGFHRDSLIEKNLLDLIHPDDQSTLLSLFQKNNAIKNRDFVQYRFRHAQGHYIWLESTWKILSNPRGEAAGAVFCSRDITDRKNLEARHKNFFELSTDLLGIATNEGYFVEINNAWEKTLGWSTEELLSKPYLSFVHPDDRDSTKKMAVRLIAGKKVEFFVNRYRCKDGSYKWISWNSIPNAAERLIYFVARDATAQIEEKTNLEEKVLESEHFLGSTINNIKGVVYHCRNDEEWTMLYLSQGCRELTGYMPEELINNSLVSFGSIVSNESRNHLLPLSNPEYEHEYKITTKNGEAKWVLDRGRTIYSEDGHAIRQEGILTDITAIKTLENELSASKERLRLVTANISEVVWLVSADNSSLYFVNQAFEDVWGLPCDVLYNDPTAFMKTIHAEDREKVSAAYENYLEGEDFDLSFRIARPDGQIRWIHAKTKTVRNDKREIIGHAGSAKDITDLKTNEEDLKKTVCALQKKDQYLLSVMETQQEMICRFLPDTTLTFANKAFCRSFGLSEEEIIGKKIIDLPVEKDFDVLMDYLKSLSIGHPSVTYEQKFIGPEGSEVCQEWTDFAIFGSNNEIVEFQSVGRDITRQKESENIIAENTKLLMKTQEVAGIGSYVVDILGDTCKSSSVLNELLGLQQTDLHPMTVWPSLIHPDDREAALLAHNASIEQLVNYNQEYRIIRLIDGAERWVSDIGEIETDDSGSAVRIIGTILDITDRKKREEELKAQRDKLKTLFILSNNMRKVTSVDGIISELINESSRLLQAAGCTITFFSPDKKHYTIIAANGLFESSKGRTFPIDAGLTGLVFTTGEVITSENYSIDPRGILLENYKHIGPMALIPLKSENTMMGVLAVSRRRESNPKSFTSFEIETLTTMGEIAGTALRRQFLFDETQERLRQVQALRNIDMAITSSLDLRATFQIILEEVAGMLKIDAAAILRFNPRAGTLKYEHWRGFRNNDIEGVTISLGEGYGGYVALNRKPLHYCDVREGAKDAVPPAFMSNEDFIAYFGAPLIAKGTLLGVLEVFHRKPLVFDEEWLSFMETLVGQAAIAVDNAELVSRLERSNAELRQAYDATIEGWAHALALKDEETEEHSQRVTEMTLRIARKMHVKEEELGHIRRGSLLHDIGKMGIPDEILLKPGKLTDDEWEIMRKHPVYAFEMLCPIDYLRPALDIPYCHHEKWDGSGYPRGLKGKQIPLAARIFALVDVFDALTSKRPYRKAWSKEKTLELVREESGKHFDPEIVEIFISTLE